MELLNEVEHARLSEYLNDMELAASYVIRFDGTDEAINQVHKIFIDATLKILKLGQEIPAEID